MQPVADHLGELLGCKVPVIEEWRLGCELNAGEVALLENVRFNIGEK
jgi:phosphoglycerate kinase